ncbi:hypothetical protein [Sunxiuqinia rutila]|uniref:hypothetical protein n=1 Tax=Sunxiuqinia rutila TaxID=1397841 RepID=UPI003D35EF23
MQLTIHRQELLDQLNQGSITVLKYWEEIKKFPRPWDTKEWKEKRKKIIKNECDKCGSTENLLIQHGWKPQYSAIRREITAKYIEKAKASFKKEKKSSSRPSTNKGRGTKVEQCPNCSSCTLSRRKTKKPTFKCLKCNHEFDKPNIIEAILTNNGYVDINRNPEIYQEKANASGEYVFVGQYLEKNKNNIDIEAINVLHRAHMRYVSLKGVKTYCKKCAFTEDKRLGLTSKHSIGHGRSIWNK